MASMADSQAWPQPATQVPMDADDMMHEVAEQDAYADRGADDGPGGFGDDSDGDNGYEAGVLLLFKATEGVLDSINMNACRHETYGCGKMPKRHIEGYPCSHICIE